MDQPNKEKLLAKWLEGKLTDDELLQSVPKNEVDEYKAILRTVDHWEPEGSDAIQSKLKQILATKKESKVVSMNRNRWITGIAASIALISIFTVFFLSDTKQTYYADGEVIEVMLPDNSTRVLLSPGAKLSYEDFDPNNREVEIEGRVYFDVTQKGAFKVNYSEGSIDVLGTQFEVVDMGGFFETTCFEGLVQVEYRGKRAKAGVRDRIAYLKGGLVKSNINRLRPGWTDPNIEEFESANLTKVIKIIESRYDISMSSDQVDLDRRFTGNIPTNNLEQACTKVFSSLGIQYKIEGKQVFLSE